MCLDSLYVSETTLNKQHMQTDRTEQQLNCISNQLQDLHSAVVLLTHFQQPIQFRPRPQVGKLAEFLVGQRCPSCYPNNNVKTLKHKFSIM